MTKPTISTATDGPFLVEGSVTIRTMTPIVSEHDEPMTWEPGLASTVDGPALCRCGVSDSKPFCDQSHLGLDWDGSDQISTESTYAERADAIEGTKLTVQDDTSLCVHAGFCGTERTSVWEMMEATEDSEVRATVIRMVEKCPSGRLVNVIDGTQVEPSLPVEIGVVPGGPLWVTGGLPITGASGSSLETRNRVTLCRCGASDSKPLCDGSHTEIDFGG